MSIVTQKIENNLKISFKNKKIFDHFQVFAVRSPLGADLRDVLRLLHHPDELREIRQDLLHLSAEVISYILYLQPQNGRFRVQILLKEAETVILMQKQERIMPQTPFYYCGQSYKASTIIIYVSRVINISNLLVSTTLDSLI